MILGSFDADGTPYVEGNLVIASLGIDEEISFLVDTGSDSTCLMPTDGTRLGIDYNTLTGPQANTYGSGGNSKPHKYRSLISFTEENKRQRTYSIDLFIYPQDPDLDILDSLLGRDVLNRWRMRYQLNNGRLEFTVVSADFTRRIRRD